jgi:hypothetical protein
MDDNRFSRRDFLKKGLKLTGGAAALTAAGDALAAGSNSIVTENALPGTPQSTWDLSTEGQYSGFGLGKSGVTHYIEGFADNISVNRGTTINFKINTDCANYRIDVYRLGYYGGNGAALKTTMTRSSASVQPTPVTNVPIGLIDCGNWSVTASWAVPGTAVAGVYIAKLTRLDGVTGANHIPFIVRDDGVSHDVVFQTSDTTWQAYNGWGGYNLYGGAGNATSSTGRAYKVSLNRPYSTRDGIGTVSGAQDFVFGAEVAAIRWLEANGYDVSYMTGLDMERLDPTGAGGQLIGRYKVYLSVGHDEYWSGIQRNNVESARAAGVHMAFMSGNEVFWKTRWENSTDSSATPYRTLVCYKETIDQEVLDPLDPPTWTGSWRDPSFSPPGDGGRPENALTGTLFMVDSWRSDVIQIPYPMTQLRFWRNTNVAKTASGGTASLVQNLLGYEWDESPDNGFQPAGQIHLSSTTLAVQSYLLDWGHVIGNYTGTHKLSLYRYQGGALVFGAGTVFWVWGLDINHDLQDLYPTKVDPNVQQATLNLLADMGVQPATIQPGLVAATQSSDVTPPVSVINALGPVTAQVAVTISGTATDTGGLVAGVEVSTDNGQTWHPCTGTTSWSYVWWPQNPGNFQILSRATDDSANTETPSAGLAVTVAAGTTLSLYNPAAVSPWGLGNAPALVGPAQDTNAVELGVQFQASVAGTVTGVRFYKNPWNVGTHIGNLWSSAGKLLATGTFSGETAFGWQTVMFSSPVVVSAKTTYIVSFHSTGGDYSDDSGYYNTVRTAGALSAPPAGGGGCYQYGAGSVFPATNDGPTNFWADVIFSSAGSSGLPPVANNINGPLVTENTALAIPASTILSQDSDPNGLTISIVSVGSPTNGTVSYNASTATITFTPTTGYTGPASFGYTITNGTQQASATVSLNVTVTTVSLFSASSVPSVVTENDSTAVELGMQFSVNAPGQAVGVRFYKGPSNTGTHVGNLWSSAGALLASVTFTGETASGWQQALFSAPVNLTQGAVYTVSYHAPVGKYSGTPNYFTAAVTNGPITAPATTNGTYAYGSGSAFPSSTYQATNYWVDIIFAQTGATQTLPPVANNISGLTATENTALAIPASTILSQDSDPNGLAISISAVGSPVNGTVSYNASTATITFTPTTGFTGNASFGYTITDGEGTASATVSLTVTAPGSTHTLFATTAVPTTITNADAAAVELGMKFQVSTAGKAQGVRFYKGPKNTGTHTGHLWSSTGTLLASVTFAGETASGWQQALFATPVALTVGTIYVISYHTAVGEYSSNANFFAAAVTNGPITAPSSAAGGGNGLYTYGTASAFPKSTFNATNYWVDVVFG